MQSSSQIRK